MRILPLVLAAVLATPLVGFAQNNQAPVQVAAAEDKPRSFEDPNEPTKTPAKGNPTPTIVEIGVIGGAMILGIIAGAGGGGGGAGATATATATATR